MSKGIIFVEPLGLDDETRPHFELVMAQIARLPREDVQGADIIAGMEVGQTRMLLLNGPKRRAGIEALARAVAPCLRDTTMRELGPEPPKCRTRITFLSRSGALYFTAITWPELLQPGGSA